MRCAVCVVRSGAAVASCWAHGKTGRDGGEGGRKGAQARATRRVAVVALRCDFFNCCWAIALALPSPPSLGPLIGHTRRVCTNAMR
jgi:hypothetical protein